MTATVHVDSTSASVGVHYDHVLVPIDGSERSTIALRTGRELASRLRATLHTVTVGTDPTRLLQVAAAAAAALDVSPTDQRVHTVESDDPAQAIAAVADGLGSCIVCMSTHAHDRFAGAFMGSVARELLRFRGRPVVMIGPFADRPVYLGDSWAEPLGVDRVVVCIDADRPSAGDLGSLPRSAASELVEVAAGWAITLGMSLTILNVAAPKVTLIGTEGRDGLEDWIARLAADEAGHHLDVDTHIEVDPIGTVEGIRSYLAAHPAGLLVVSTRARDGLDRLVHGATAAGITAASTIATLVVPISQQGEQP
jgi:nucleotide-binding universal stress UspA family protein